MFRIRLAGLVLAALTAAGGVHTDANAGTRELRFADFGPNRGTRAKAIEWFDQQLRERSGGELGLKITWGGTLLGAKNAIEGLTNGVADMASVVAVYEPGKLVSIEAVDVPQISDEWVAMRASYDFLKNNEAAASEFAKRNLRYISHFTTGPTQLIANKPVRTAADVAGMKIRATGNFISAFNSAGATTVSMSQPEVYEALSNGTIDGSAAYYYVVRAYKLYETGKFLSELNLGQSLGWGIVMNSRTWDSLTEKQQAVLDRLGADFVDHLAEAMYKSRMNIREELGKGIDGHVVTVVQPDPALRQQMIEAAEAKGMEWLGKAAAKDLPGEAMLADLRERLSHYRAIRDQKGYPWER